MALTNLFRFFVVSGSFYLTKELGLFNKVRQDVQSNNLESSIIDDDEKSSNIKATHFKLEKHDGIQKVDNSDCKCKSKLPAKWIGEFENAWLKTLTALQTLPGHWQRLSQSMQENLRQFFKPDK